MTIKGETNKYPTFRSDVWSTNAANRGRWVPFLPGTKISEGVSYVLNQRLKSWIHYVMTFWCESSEYAEEKHTLCKLKTAEGLLRATKASHLDNIVKKKY